MTRRLFFFLAMVSCNAITGIDDYKFGADAASADATPSDDGGRDAPLSDAPLSDADAGSMVGCANAAILCYACMGVNVVETCFASTAGSCIQNASYNHCGCDSVADCPGATQTCVQKTSKNFECRTCGEAMTMDASCKNGKTCDEPNAACK
jgi:hypothetical protein